MDKLPLRHLYSSMLESGILKIGQPGNEKIMGMSMEFPFNLALSMRGIPGYDIVDKFGVNPAITTASDPEDVWEFGGIYNYDDFGTAPILYLSSSDNADTQTISVLGLDIDGNEVEQTVVLTGQTNANLSTPLWRVYRMENESETDIAGVVYCHTDPTPTAGVPAGIAVRAIINDDNNQTLMALYTIPKGKIAFLFRGEIGLEFTGSPGAGTNYATVDYRSRRLGKVFKTKKRVSCISAATSIIQDVRSFPDLIPALTDIKITAQEVSEDLGVWATMDFLLIDETEFTEEFLQSIGQPGY